VNAAPLPPPSGRMPGLDVGRVAAAVAVVWLHTAGIGPRVAPAGAAGRFAVPYFTLLAAALVADRCACGATPALGRFVRGRVARLYLPFLFWTAVYLGLRLAKHAWRPAGPPPPVGSHLLVIGSAHHLWYLPYLLAVSVAARAVAPTLASLRPVAAVACVLAGAAVALTPASLPHDPSDAGFENQVNYLLGLGWGAAPSALWGLAVGLYLRPVAAVLAERPAAALAAGLAAAALLAPGDAFAGRVPRENLSGAAAFAACLMLPAGGWIRGVAALGRYAFGVYAIHVAFILAIEVAVVRDRAAFSIGEAVCIFVGATAGSFAAAALARSRWSAWAVS